MRRATNPNEFQAQDPGHPVHVRRRRRGDGRGARGPVRIRRPLAEEESPTISPASQPGRSALTGAATRDVDRLRDGAPIRLVQSPACHAKAARPDSALRGRRARLRLLTVRAARTRGAAGAPWSTRFRSGRRRGARQARAGRTAGRSRRGEVRRTRLAPAATGGRGSTKELAARRLLAPRTARGGLAEVDPEGEEKAPSRMLRRLAVAAAPGRGEEAAPRLDRALAARVPRRAVLRR